MQVTNLEKIREIKISECDGIHVVMYKLEVFLKVLTPDTQFTTTSLSVYTHQINTLYVSIYRIFRTISRDFFSKISQ